MMSRAWGVAALVCGLFLVLGCGPSVGRTHKVSGKVTFSDGTPLTKGQVVFTSERLSAQGVLGEDGTYSLTTVNPGDGAPEGTYKVYIAGEALGGYPDNIPLIDPKFGDATKSGLETKVVAGKNEFNITVEKPPQ